MRSDFSLNTVFSRFSGFHIGTGDTAWGVNRRGSKMSQPSQQVGTLLPMEPLYRACIGPLFILWKGCTGRFTNPVAVLLAGSTGCRISLYRVYESPMRILRGFFKAVVKRKNPRTPAFQPFMKLVSYFFLNNSMRYNVCTNWEPPYAHKHPCSRRARTKLGG